MKRLLTNFLLLLLSIPFFSYGMSDDQPGHGFLADVETWLSSSSWRKSAEREKRRRDKEADTEEHAPKRQARKPGQPLPPLKILHEQGTPATLAYPAYPITPASIGAPNINPGQSNLELLPLELFELLMHKLPAQALKNLALASKKCREKVRGITTHLLTLTVDNITPEMLQYIVHNFPNIKSLSIKGSGITPEHITLLAQTFPAITSLDLQETGLTLEGVRRLAEPTAFTALKALNLSNNTLGDEAIELLAYAPFANSLELLDLTNTDITGHAIKIFADSQQFTHLKDLRLARNAIEFIDTDDEYTVEFTVEQKNGGIRFLSETAFVNTLESLDLTYTNLTGYQLELFTRPGKFKAIKKLILGLNDDLTDMFNENGADVYGTYTYQYRSPFDILAQTSFAPMLNALIIDGESSINMDDIKILATTFPSLEVLRITNNKNLNKHNEQEGPISILAQAPFAQQLKELAITGVTREDLEALCLFKALEVLDLKFHAPQPKPETFFFKLKLCPLINHLKKLKIRTQWPKQIIEQAVFGSNYFRALTDLDIN